MPVHHVKGQSDSSTDVREKGCLKKHTNRETPCSCEQTAIQCMYKAGAGILAEGKFGPTRWARSNFLEKSVQFS